MCSNISIKIVHDKKQFKPIKLLNLETPPKKEKKTYETQVEC